MLFISCFFAIFAPLPRLGARGRGNILDEDNYIFVSQIASFHLNYILYTPRPARRIDFQKTKSGAKLIKN